LPLPRAKKTRSAPAPTVLAPVAAIPVDVPAPVVAPEAPSEDAEDAEAPSEDAEDREVEAEILRQCAAMPITAELLAARLAPMSHRQIAGDLEADLILRYQAGDRNAGEILLLAHDKAIRFWAKKHGGGVHDLEKGDLYTASQVGFLKGVERFDLRQGVKLITYAGHWAKHRIQRVVANEGTTIRVPVHMRDRPANKRHAIEAHRALHPARLDAPLLTHYEEGREQTLLDVIAAEGVPAEEQAITTQDRARVRAVVDRLNRGLNPRERAIVEHRWMTDEQKSLREVGDMFGISRERVRQIEETLAAKARKAFERAGLHDLYAPLTPKPAPATLPKSPPIAAATL
jgi:RNA polymerase primary sigma factor